MDDMPNAEPHKGSVHTRKDGWLLRKQRITSGSPRRDHMAREQGPERNSETTKADDQDRMSMLLLFVQEKLRFKQEKGE